ncbi:DUF4238 domain-containing protein [Acidocella sp.]|uniref:DUF4238 domain-containing protein n=1 Tax=Acidocella sp. TaxID=50710 RepID=UPI00261A33AC|nr:DUF4238 domain-containing protein [Acidocella sp.]
MAKQTTKRCHWVSQSYLRAFAADESGQKIWRLSKNAGDPELKRIDKVAVKFHLYAPLESNGQRNDSLERKFSNLEQWFSHPVWQALCTTEVDLTWEPVRKMLALIVATTYVRNPLQFEHWKQMHGQFVEQLSRFDNLPSHVTIGNITREVDPSDWPNFRNAGEENMKTAWNDYVAGAGGIAPRLLDMRMVMLVAERPMFITSDNPVTIMHPSLEFHGIDDPKTAIALPISPTRALVLDNRHSEPDGAYYALADGNPTPINLLVWRNAMDHMFSSRHPDEVCAELSAHADNR